MYIAEWSLNDHQYLPTISETSVCCHTNISDNILAHLFTSSFSYCRYTKCSPGHPVGHPNASRPLFRGPVSSPPPLPPPPSPTPIQLLHLGPVATITRASSSVYSGCRVCCVRCQVVRTRYEGLILWIIVCMYEVWFQCLYIGTRI